MGSNDIHDKKRFTKTEYRHNRTKWIINQPTRTLLSSDGNNWKQLSRTDYYTSGDYASRGLPKDVYRYNTKIKTYTEWHATGELKKVEDNLNLTTGTGKRWREYTDYYRGLPKTIKSNGRYSATAIEATREVNDDGWVTRTTDFNGVTKDFTYDNAGRLKSIQPEADSNHNLTWNGTLYTWDNVNGLPRRTMQHCMLNTTKTACNSGTADLTQYELFDNGLRLIQTRSVDGSENRYINYDYNSMGLQTFASFPGNSATIATGTTRTFDALGRLTSQSTTDGGTVNHEYLSGNRVRLTNARNHSTTTTYLAYGEPAYDTAELIASEVNSSQKVYTEMNVKIFGEITSITQSDGGEVEKHVEYRAYDNNHYLCKISRGDTGITVFTHNSLGELLVKAEGVGHGTIGTNTLGQP